jgi:hypothetical protein
MALPFLNSVLDGDEWSASRPDRLTPRKSPIPIGYEAGWAPEPA